jgi:selenobiotic family peptide radical SAM maturase
LRPPAFLPELAALEWTCHAVTQANVDFPEDIDKFQVNPALEVLRLSRRLRPLLSAQGYMGGAGPEAGEEWALVWRDLESGETLTAAASNEDLLAVKIVVEELSTAEAARAGNVPVHAIDGVLARAAQKGLLIAPRSRIRRDTAAFTEGENTPDLYVTAHTFTLQWHITQACDLHCKHCYDRSKRSPLTLKEAVAVLDDMRGFCKERRVRGHICFTGGNPLMYPHFLEVYEAAADRGFSTSILGNPTPAETIQEVLNVQRPGYFQVSLEGLREHNDSIRGRGNFDHVMEFLGVLRELDLSSAVMLTLTADNMDQVLPLAELLRDRTDYFTFNRLSPVGEGANLQVPAREEYAAFLEEYVEAAQDNPIIGFKDNLISCELHRRGMELFDGCTGFGCGAAFNFLAILPDGEAHACRKFPSPLGNILEQGIADVYDSELAEQYRKGTAACAGCELRPVCGGCLAAANGCGLDIFAERDPLCSFVRRP